MKTPTFYVSLLLSMFIGTNLSKAGGLNPPAAPGSTMKTLDEVEPRIPIPASAAPTTTFQITQSGSYYLTGDRHCLGTSIQINTDNVTIDLSGFSLIGPDTATNNSGIYIGGHSNIEVRNGTIEAFGYGIYDTSSNGTGQRILSVRVLNNKFHGVYLLGNRHVIQNCTFRGNGIDAATSGTSGITVGQGAIITNNDVSENSRSCPFYSYGISAGSGSVVSGNAVNNNGQFAASNFYAIYVGQGSVVSGNSCSHNGTDATGEFLTVAGIYANSGSVIKDNSVYLNAQNAEGSGYGVYASYYCLVSHNTVYLNKDHNLSYSTGCVLDQNVAP